MRDLPVVPPAAVFPSSSESVAPGLYVHIPFCKTKCPYCDFYSVTNAPEDTKQTLVAALLDELDWHLAQDNAETWQGFDSLYIGGGTPSLLSPDLFLHLVAGLRTKLRSVGSGLVEVTCEVNPADVTEELLDALAEGGVTRISLGVQSFLDEELRLLGRRHDASGARAALDRIHRFFHDADRPDLCLDLIHDLPGSTQETWRANLDAALQYAPDHLSCYALTIAEGTPFDRWVQSGRLHLPPDELREDQYFLAHEILTEQAGYDHYEVSNYARTPSHRARHNTKYWTGVPYLGLGPAAHSFDGARRWWNPRSATGYIRAVDSMKRAAPGRVKPPREGWEAIGPRQAAIESLGLGLRWVGGVCEDFLVREFGEAVLELLEQFLSDGLLERQNERLVPTVRGLALADGMAAAILVAASL